MTISVGVLCPEAMVFCADQQITVAGSHKSYETKLAYIHGDDWHTLFSYAGSPDRWKAFLVAFSEHVASLARPIDCEAIRASIEYVLVSRYTVEDIANLQLMCGAVIPGKERRLFKTHGHRAGETWGVNYIGCGDSSVLAFVLQMIGGDSIKLRTIGHGVWIAAYLVQCAKRWIDGCGGSTDLWILHDNGGLVNRSSVVSKVEGTMNSVEGLAANVVNGFLDADKQRFERDLDLLCRTLRDKHSQLTPLVIEGGTQRYPEQTTADQSDLPPSPESPGGSGES